MAIAGKRAVLVPLAAILIAACSGWAALPAGILDEARSAVRETESSSSSSSDDHHGHGHSSGGYGSCDDDCDPAGDLLGQLMGALVQQLFTQHSGERSPVDAYAPTVLNDYFFLRFPYDRGSEGYLVWEASLYDTPPTPLTASQLAAGEPPPPQPSARSLPPMRTGAVRLWFDYGNDFDDLERWRGGMLLQSSAGPAAELEWNTYLERTPGGVDQIHVGEANALFRIYASERIQWMWGGGLAWLDDRTETNFGYNLTLKADFFPVKPWVFSGDLDYGEIGRAHVFHANASVGVLYRRYEIFGGYDYRNIESAELQGPMFGVRLWY